MCLTKTDESLDVVCGLCGKKMGQTTFNRDGHIVVGHTCDDCDRFVKKHIDAMIAEAYGAEKK